MVGRARLLFLVRILGFVGDLDVLLPEGALAQVDKEYL